jgi:hypothetical protein
MKVPTLRIGTARSGHVIYIFMTDDQELINRQLMVFRPEDHFDAWVVFERLTVREFRRVGDGTSDFTKFREYATLHQGKMTNQFIDAEMARLGLATSLDLVRFAAKLTENVFLD